AGFAGGVAWESQRHEMAPRDSIAAAPPPTIAPAEPAPKLIAPIEQAAPVVPEHREVVEAKTPSSPRSARDLVDELRRLAAQKPPADWREIDQLMKQLVALGTEEAIGFALELMEDESFDFSHRARSFHDLFWKIRDPRVEGAARRVLERNVREGLDSWDQTQGYISLAARRGDREAGDFLLSLVRARSSESVSTIAAAAIGSLKDHTIGEAFLDLVRTNHSDSVSIIDGLAQWRDPALIDELTRLAIRPDAPIDRLDLVGQSLGRSVDADGFSRFVSRCRSAGDDRERELSLCVIGQLSRNGQLDATSLAPQAIPILRDALGDPRPGVWQQAMWAIRDNQPYRVSELLDVVQSLANDDPDPDRQAAAKRLVAELLRR
ncbi:MAG: hypothetical protein HYR85_24040, partial [Planctomycetes bacterium]|nr:hypothetical protein [Planctomycetota bacterium]